MTKEKKLSLILDLLLDLINLYSDTEDKFIIRQSRNELTKLKEK